MLHERWSWLLCTGDCRHAWRTEWSLTRMRALRWKTRALGCGLSGLVVSGCFWLLKSYAEPVMLGLLARGTVSVFVLSGILRLENVSQYCESHLEVIEQPVKHLQRVPSGKIAEVSVVAESLITDLFGDLD